MLRSTSGRKLRRWDPPVSNVMKPFPLATDENEKKAREFVPGKLLKPCVIIVSSF